MSKANLQYVCGNCQNILRESDFDIDVSASNESCNFCGVLVSHTIQKRFAGVTKHPSVVFKKASSIPKLTLDIPQIDEKLHFLTLNDKICIRGIHTQNLVERLCVRAQLPTRYAGLNSQVLLVDGANSSDLYLCVDFAQQYGLNVNKILDGVVSSRAFTLYQLANTIIKELPHVIKHHNAKLVVVTNLLYYFTNNLHLDSSEMKSILKEIIKAIEKIQDCLVVISLGFPTQYDDMFTELFTKTIDIQQRYGALSVHIDHNGRQSSLFLKSEELGIVPQH